MRRASPLARTAPPSSVSLPSLRPLRYEALGPRARAERRARTRRPGCASWPMQCRHHGRGARRRRSSAAVVWRRRSAAAAACAPLVDAPGRSNAEIAQSMQALIQSKAELANIQQRVDSMLKTYEQGEVDEAIAAVTEREDDFLPEEFPVVEDALQEGDAAAALQHLLGTLKRRAAETVDELSSQNEQQLHGLSLVLGWFGDASDSQGESCPPPLGAVHAVGSHAARVGAAGELPGRCQERRGAPRRAERRGARRLRRRHRAAAGRAWRARGEAACGGRSAAGCSARAAVASTEQAEAHGSSTARRRGSSPARGRCRSRRARRRPVGCRLRASAGCPPGGGPSRTGPRNRTRRADARFAQRRDHKVAAQASEEARVEDVALPLEKGEVLLAVTL